MFHLPTCRYYVIYSCALLIYPILLLCTDTYYVIYPRVLHIYSEIYSEYFSDLHASLKYDGYMEFHLSSFDQPGKSLHKWTHPIYILISCFFTIHLNIILLTSISLLSYLVLSDFPTKFSAILRYLMVRPSTS